MDRSGHFLVTADDQFGFKKGLGCNNSMYYVHNVVEHFTSGVSTVNLCALDLSKAFDNVNHHEHRMCMVLMFRTLYCILKVVMNFIGF